MGDAEPAPRPGRDRQKLAETVLLLGLVASGFLVRIWPLWQVHFWDEAVYLQNAEVICCGKTNYSELSSRPPLLSLLFAAVFLMWHNVYAASILTAALNALGPLFLYLGGRRLVGKAGAGIGALLLAFSPFFVSSGTGNSLLTDSPALTLILMALWLLLAAEENNRGLWFGLAGFVSALAVLMRFASLPTVAVVSLLLLRAKRWFQAALQFGIGFALGVGPYLLWSRVRYGGVLATLHRAWQNTGRSAQPGLYYLQNLSEVFPWITVAGLALWLVGRLLDTRLAREKARDQLVIRLGRGEAASAGGRELFLWGWALVVLAYFSALTHKETRYILPLAPPVFLLAGRGLAVLLRGARLRVRAVGAAILVAGLLYSFAPDLGRFRGPFISPFVSEEKEVSDFLNRHATPGTVLYANYNCPVFGFYTRLPVHILPDDATIFFEEFPRNMPSDGYLIVYKQIDKEPNPDWVDSNPHFRRFQEFPSLVIYAYQAKTS